MPLVLSWFLSKPKLGPVPKPNHDTIRTASPKNNIENNRRFRIRLSGNGGKSGHFKGMNRYIKFAWIPKTRISSKYANGDNFDLCK